MFNEFDPVYLVNHVHRILRPSDDPIGESSVHGLALASNQQIGTSSASNKIFRLDSTGNVTTSNNFVFQGLSGPSSNSVTVLGQLIVASGSGLLVSSTGGLTVTSSASTNVFATLQRTHSDASNFLKFVPESTISAGHPQFWLGSNSNSYNLELIRYDGSTELTLLKVLANGTITILSGTTITGNLSVSGTSTLRNSVEIKSDLAVAGSTTVTGSSTVNGSSVLNTLQTTGTTRLHNAFVSGNLTVTGSTYVTGDVTINGDTSISGSATVYSDLSVSGSSTVENSLTVSGHTSMNTLQTTGVTNIHSLNVSGNTRVTGSLAVVAGDFSVNGDSSLTGSLTIDGNTSLTGSFSVSTGPVSLDGDTSITGNLLVTENAEIIGSSFVSGNSRVTGSFTVLSGANVGGNLSVAGTSALTGDVVFSSGVTASGNIYLALSSSTKVGLNTLSPESGLSVNSNAVFRSGTTLNLLTLDKATQNLIQYSTDFQDDYWSKNNLTHTPSNGLRPDGSSGLTDGYTPPFGQSGYVSRTGLATTSGNYYTFSIWLLHSGPPGATIDIQISDGSGSTSKTVVLTGSWQRFSVTRQINHTTCTVTVGSSSSWSNSETIALWGAQFEAGQYPTGYVPSSNSSPSVESSLVSTNLRRVGFFTDSPSEKFEVNSNATFRSGVTISGATVLKSSLGLSGSLISESYIYASNTLLPYPGYRSSFSFDSYNSTIDGIPDDTSSTLTVNSYPVQPELQPLAVSFLSPTGIMSFVHAETGTNTYQKTSVAFAGQPLASSSVNSRFFPANTFTGISFLALSPTATQKHGDATGQIISAGLYIQPQEVGVVTKGYGIYQAGSSDENVFLGSSTFGGYTTLTGGVFLSGTTILRDFVNLDVDTIGSYAGSLILGYGSSSYTTVGTTSVTPGYGFDVNKESLFRLGATVNGSLDVKTDVSVSGSVELVRNSTNYLYNSEDFSGWSKSNVDINLSSPDKIDPEGLLTATQLTAANLGDSSISVSRNGLSIGSSYTFSVWIKKGDSSPSSSVKISISNSDGSNSTSVLCSLTTSWTRFSVTKAVSDSTSDITIGGDNTWNNLHTIQVWGSQFESGISPTPYVKTSGTLEQKGKSIYASSIFKKVGIHTDTPLFGLDVNSEARVNDLLTLGNSTKYKNKNLFIYSNDLSRSPWLKTSAVVRQYLEDNSIVRLLSASAPEAAFYQVVWLEPGTYTFSVDLKADVAFNGLRLSAVKVADDSVVNQSDVDLTTSYQRFSLSFIIVDRAEYYIKIGGYSTWPPLSEIYVKEPQLELASSATSYEANTYSNYTTDVGYAFGNLTARGRVAAVSENSLADSIFYAGQNDTYGSMFGYDGAADIGYLAIKSNEWATYPKDRKVINWGISDSSSITISPPGSTGRILLTSGRNTDNNLGFDDSGKIYYSEDTESGELLKWSIDHSGNTKFGLLSVGVMSYTGTIGATTFNASPSCTYHNLITDVGLTSYVFNLPNIVNDGMVIVINYPAGSVSNYWTIKDSNNNTLYSDKTTHDKKVLTFVSSGGSWIQFF